MLGQEVHLLPLQGASADPCPKELHSGGSGSGIVISSDRQSRAPCRTRKGQGLGFRV